MLRFAQFYSADSDYLSTLHSMKRKRLPALLGQPDSYTSFVHAHDAAAAVVVAIEAPSGTYNVGLAVGGVVVKIARTGPHATTRSVITRMTTSVGGSGRANSTTT